MMNVLNTLHRNSLPSLVFSPPGRDKSEGAGCENLGKMAAVEVSGGEGGNDEHRGSALWASFMYFDFGG